MEHSQYPPNGFLYVNVDPSSFVTVLPSPPVVTAACGVVPDPFVPELPLEPELLGLLDELLPELVE